MGRTTKHITWDQLGTLVSRMKEDGHRLHLFARIQSYMGLRGGDVLKLRWVDLLDNTEISFIESKTGKTRSISINPELKIDVLEEYNRKFGNKKKDLIFLNRLGTGAMSLSYVNRQFKQAFKKYEIEADQVSTHVFRKTFAYKVLEDGDFSEKAIFLVSRLLNHANINITMRYLLLDKKEESAAYLNLKL